MVASINKLFLYKHFLFIKVADLALFTLSNRMLTLGQNFIMSEIFGRDPLVVAKKFIRGFHDLYCDIYMGWKPTDSSFEIFFNRLTEDRSGFFF